MIPVLELEKSCDARFGNIDSRFGTYEKNFVPERDTYILARTFLQLCHYQKQPDCHTGKATGLVLCEVSQFVIVV